MKLLMNYSDSKKLKEPEKSTKRKHKKYIKN